MYKTKYYTSGTAGHPVICIGTLRLSCTKMLLVFQGQPLGTYTPCNIIYAYTRVIIPIHSIRVIFCRTRKKPLRLFIIIDKMFSKKTHTRTRTHAHARTHTHTHTHTHSHTHTMAICTVHRN